MRQSNARILAPVYNCFMLLGYKFTEGTKCMANKEHLNTLKQGAEAWNTWRKGHPDTKADLTDADLSGTNLRGVDLSEVDLSRADLRGTDPHGLNLHGACLYVAN